MSFKNNVNVKINEILGSTSDANMAEMYEWDVSPKSICELMRMKNTYDEDVTRFTRIYGVDLDLGDLIIMGLKNLQKLPLADLVHLHNKAIKFYTNNDIPDYLCIKSHNQDGSGFYMVTAEGRKSLNILVNVLSTLAGNKLQEEALDTIHKFAEHRKEFPGYYANASNYTGEMKDIIEKSKNDIIYKCKALKTISKDIHRVSCKFLMRNMRNYNKLKYIKGYRYVFVWWFLLKLNINPFDPFKIVGRHINVTGGSSRQD